MSFPCVSCSQPVRPRQHALECESCFRWQHRLCNTGVSATDYRRLVNNEVDIIFHCNDCAEVPLIEVAEEATEIQDGIAADPPAPPTPPASPVRPASPDQSLHDHSFNITIEVAEPEAVVERS